MAVVLSYNNPRELEKTVKALASEVDLVYVIDNGSTLNNAKRIKNFKEKCHFEVVFLGDNLGIGAALNFAVSKAINENFDWLLTMDQDSQFHPGFMREFYECALQTGSKVLAANTRKVNCQSSCYITRLAITSGNLVSVSVYNEIGCYNEWLFIDGVDFEFSFRLQAHNIPIVQVGGAILNHKLGDREVRWCRKVHSFHSPLRRYYIFRNHLYLMRMFYKKFPSQIAKITISRLCYFFTILAFGDRRIKSLKYIFEGIFDFTKGVAGRKMDNQN